MLKFWISLLPVLVCLPAIAESPADPLYTSDRSPVVIGAGLPGRESAQLIEPGWLSVGFFVDIANNATDSLYNREQIVLDGETTRMDLRLRYGAGEKWQLGCDLVWLNHSGGRLDGFITSWHDRFRLFGGDREEQPDNRLQYRFARNGQVLLNLDRAARGTGDSSISAAYRWRDETGSKVALRGGIELPTGDADRLLGSGSTDMYFELVNSRSIERERRTLTLHGGAGLLWRGEGDILPRQQKKGVAYGFAALDWPASEALHLKVQLNAHSGMFDADVPELASISLQLLMGGTALLGHALALDVSVTEDLIGEAPDIGLQLGLRYQRTSSQSSRNSLR